MEKANGNMLIFKEKIGHGTAVSGKNAGEDKSSALLRNGTKRIAWKTIFSRKTK